MKNLRIAVLEDDPDQSALLTHWLSSAEHNCEAFEDAAKFKRAFRQASYDLALVDWLLPGESGIEVLQWLRRDRQNDLPILFVTSKEEESDIVSALQAGADDYLVKPVRKNELLARINALIRRVQGDRTILNYSPFLIDIEHRTLKLNGVAVHLTDKEFDLAVFLFRNLGRVLSRDHILGSVWVTSPDLNTRTVDTHVSRLRHKLALTPDSGWKLSAIYQHGYRLESLENVTSNTV